MTQLAAVAGYDHDVVTRHHAGHPAQHGTPRATSTSGPAGGTPTARRVGTVNIAQLQRMAGNRAVAGLLGRPTQVPRRPPMSPSSLQPTTIPDAVSPPVQRLSLTEL